VQTFCSAAVATMSPDGSVTAALAVLALSGGPVITVRSAGERSLLTLAAMVGLNGSCAQAVGVNGGAARVTVVPPAPRAVTRAIAGMQPVGIVMNRLASVRFIDSIHISIGSPATRVLDGRPVMIESRPPSAGRSATRDVMNAFSAPSGGRTTTPSRAGSPALGATLYTSPSAVTDVPSSAGIVVLTDVVPTWLPAGQSSAAKSAWLQRAVARGLPTTPGGRLNVRSRACSGGFDPL
jgi:hypothetical protein